MPGSRPVAHELTTMNTPGGPQVAQLLKPLNEFKRSVVVGWNHRRNLRYLKTSNTQPTGSTRSETEYSAQIAGKSNCIWQHSNPLFPILRRTVISQNVLTTRTVYKVTLFSDRK